MNLTRLSSRLSPILSFLVLISLSCSSLSGPGDFESETEELELGSGSDPESQPYHLLVPKFESPFLSPAPRFEGHGGLLGEAFSLDWPVTNVKLTQKFHPPTNPSHQGIDLGGKLNTPILAAHSGIVIYAGTGFRGYGKMMIIEHSEQWATLYAHLNRFKVKTGEWVAKGQLVGKMGRTGRASGVHLHFELIRDKIPIDPLSILRWPGEIAKSSDHSQNRSMM